MTLIRNEAWLGLLETRYPGIREIIDGFESRILPACPRCGSEDTAEVNTGICGYSIHVASATSRIRLLPNGHPADFFCNRCMAYFDGPRRGSEEARETDEGPEPEYRRRSSTFLG